MGGFVLVDAPEVVTDVLGESLGEAVFSAAVFVVAFVVLWLVGKTVVQPLVRRVLDRRELDKHARKPLMKITRFVVVFAALAVAFGVAGFGNLLTSLATIAAAATLAVGFALQNVIRNFVSGIFIYIEKPFKIDDWIEWDGNSGIVEDISLRVTRVRTFDSELLTVPNSELTENVVKNPVDDDRLRLKFVFGIGYGDDIGKATDIIIEEAEAHDGIMNEPAPSVRVHELADSYVGLQSRVWIHEPSRADFVKVRSEYVKNVKEHFDEEGIEIPFPQRDLSGVVETRATEGERVG